MRTRLLLILLSLSSLLMAQTPTYLLTGTYTNGKSKGIYVFRFDKATGDATLVDSALASNPSYLAFSPNRKFVYAASEEKEGKVMSYRFDSATGKLQRLNEQPSHGAHPCYITVDKTGRWVIVGNYSSGTLASYPGKGQGVLCARLNK